jgi:RHS repeat-associated protein
MRTWRHRALAGLIPAADLVAGATPAWALDGPAPGAVSAETLKLPDGPGSVRGLASDPSVDVFSGQVSYEVPIEVPAARRGLAPKLSLAYRGDLGNGPLGVGWSVRTVAIERSTRLGTPRFDASDELLLTGVGAGGRLVAVGDGSYRVEGRGNELRIVPEGAGFRVWDAEGVQYRLGTTSAGRQEEGAHVAAWMVEEVVDPTGQHIRYDYTRDQGQLYLAQVTWGPGDAFRAIFELTARPDVTTSWRSGLAVVTAQRFGAVRVEAFGEVLRRYALGYDDSLPLSRLHDVRMTGRGGAGSLPPLTFGYGGRDAPVLAQLGSIDGWRLNERGVSLVDVDGDGVGDLLRLEEGNHEWRRNEGGHFAAPVSLTGDTASSLSNARLVDVEGRARPDLVTVVGNTWRPFRLSGPGWTALGDWTGTSGVPLEGDSVELADVNGDGRIDAVEWNATGLFIRYGTATGLAAPVSRPLVGGVLAPGPDVRWADLNGDGLTDVTEVNDHWLGFYMGRGDGTFTARRLVDLPAGALGVERSRLRFGDLNRDGLLDLVVVSASAVDWFAGLPGQGAQAFAATPVHLGGPETAGQDVVVALTDADGNGSEDVVWSSPRGMWVLDLAGATTAGMLTSIDNGMGKRLDIAYESSAVLARQAALAGEPWARYLQVAIPVAVRSALRPSQDAPARITEYTVRDGFWDSAEYRFGGFGLGRTTTRGGSPSLDLVEETTFHLGTGTNRVLRGKPTQVKRADGAGTIFDITYNTWRAATITGLSATEPLLRKPVLQQTWTDNYQGVATPIRLRSTYSVDAEGRVNREVHEGRLDLNGDERTIERTWASDDALWVRDRIVEEKIFSAGGALVADTQTFYGDSADAVLPFGQIGKGWERRRTGYLADAASPRWVTLKETRYDTLGNATSISERGITRRLGYDARGLHPTSETVEPQAGTQLLWTATWDDVLGKPSTVTEPSGVQSTMRYDALGRPESVASGTAAPHQRFVYDWERDLPRTITYVFDGDEASLPATVAWAPGSGWRESVQVMNGQGELVLEATRTGATRWNVREQRARDLRGNVVAITRPYDVDGEMPPALAPTGTPATLTSYDALGRATGQLLPDGIGKTVGYTAFNVTTSASGLAAVSSQADGFGRVFRTERTVNGALEVGVTSYDAADRITGITLNGTVSSSFSYDTLGRLVAATDPDVGPRTLSYDDGGRLVRHQNGAGQVVGYGYDLAGRLTSLDLDGTRAYTYHYDLPRSGSAPLVRGQLAWVDEPEGTADLRYDGRGRQVGLTRSIRGVSGGESRTLSPSGLVRRVVSDDGFSYDVRYDDAGRATSVPGLWTAVSLDAAGDPADERFGNGVRQVTGRDAAGLVASVRVANPENQALYDVSVTRTAAGALDRVSDVDGVGLDHTADFDYDAAARLTHARLGGATGAYTFDYGYDALQNMTLRTISGPASVNMLAGSYRYGENGAGPRQLTSVVNGLSVAKLTYDLAGRAKVTGTDAYTFNALDQLTRVTRRAAGGARLTSHSYGYDGQRVLTQEPDGSLWRWFTPTLVERDGARDRYISIGDHIVARVRTVTATPPTRRFDRLAGGLVGGFVLLGLLLGAAALLGSAAAGRRRFAAAALVSTVLAGPVLGGCATGGTDGLAQRESAIAIDRMFFHYGIGNGPVLMTGASGALAEERRYEPFGADLDAYRPGGVGTVDFRAEPHNSLNKPTDPSTGLSFHGARWMSPVTGRWLSADPPMKAPYGSHASDPFDLHPYQYVNQNPVAFWDPDGREAWTAPEHWEKVTREEAWGSDEYVDNWESATSNVNKNDKRENVVVYYADGSKQTIPLARIPIDWSEEATRQHEVDTARSLGLPEGYRIANADSNVTWVDKDNRESWATKVAYYRVGHTILPIDERNGNIVFNKGTTPNLVAAATRIHNHEVVWGFAVQMAELTYTFAGLIQRGTGHLQNNWNAGEMEFTIDAGTRGINEAFNGFKPDDK